MGTPDTGRTRWSNVQAIGGIFIRTWLPSLAMLACFSGVVGLLALAGYMTLLTVVLPYAAVSIGVVGCAVRLWHWASTPVPFPIPVTGGQSGSLDAPMRHTTAGVRLFLETALFRSLMRNTKAARIGSNVETLETMSGSRPGMRLALRSAPGLWGAALAFHICLALILIRHLRLWLIPVPEWLQTLEALDGFFHFGAPTVMLSGPVLLGALLALAVRRLCNPLIRRITLPGDAFALCLLLGLALSGMALRHLWRIDLTAAKLHLVSLARFTPDMGLAAELSPFFVIHLALACLLLAILPFSQLLHGPGLLLTPTRTVPCNTRERRYGRGLDAHAGLSASSFRSYADYEAAFHDAMKEAELPLERPIAESKAGGS